MLNNYFRTKSFFYILIESIITIIDIISIFILTFPLFVIWRNLFFSLYMYWFILILLIPIPVFRFLINNLSYNKIILKINNLNTFIKNYFITVHEIYKKENISSIENELIEEFRAVKDDIHIFNIQKFRRTIFIFVIGIIMNLILITVMPLWYSNAMNFTMKNVILKVQNGNIEKYSANMGLLKGNLFVVYNNTIIPKNLYSGSPIGRQIYYKGPMVMSNSINMELIESLYPDSVKSIIKPPKYQKLSIDTQYGNIINIMEFSDISIYWFIENDTINKTVKMLCNSKSDTVGVNYHNNTFEVNINIKQDEYPICGFLKKDQKGFLSDIIEIPFFIGDDYSIDYAGVLKIQGNDTVDYRINEINDSIFIYRMFTNENESGKYTLIAYAKDNNPFRKQLTFSEPFILRFFKDDKHYEFVKDSIAQFSNESAKSKELISRFEKAKNMLTNKNNEKAIKEFKDAVKELDDFSKQMKEKLEKLSTMKMENELYKQIYEIKKKIDKLDKELLNRIFKNNEMQQLTAMNKKQAEDYIKKNSDKIIESLKQFEKMLDKLEHLSDLIMAEKAIESMIQKEEKIIKDNDFEKQNEITEGLNELSEKLKNNVKTTAIRQDIKQAENLSAKTEKNSENAEELLEEMKDIQKQLNEQIDGMTNSDNIDINTIIISLYGLNQYLYDSSNDDNSKNTYKRIYEYMIKKSPNNPLSNLIYHAYKMANMETEDEALIEFNMQIIAFLLNQKSDKQGQGMSLEQMMSQMQNMSKKEQAISEMLKELMNMGAGEPQILQDIANMQREMAGKMKKMNEGGGKLLGELEHIADSLEDISDKIFKGNLSEELLSKEKRILNRMLNIQKSVYRQGITEERESSPGIYIPGKIEIITPDNLGYKYNKKRELIFKYLKELNYPEYESRIRQYIMEIFK